MYYIYVIKSLKDSRLYKGITNNLQRRLKGHNDGKQKSTKSFKPWKLVYYEKYEKREEARKREIYLKSGSGREL